MLYFWIRQQVRKVMRPVPHKKAERLANMYTLLYFITAWSICGIAISQYTKQRNELKQKDPLQYAMNSGYMYGQTRQLNNLHIYSIGSDGIKKEGEFNYDPTEAALKEEKEAREFFGDEKEEN